VSEVFISRTSADDDFVAELRQRLTAQGVPVWVDSRNLRGGDTLAPEIERANTAASHVVVVLSTATVNSEWVSREVVKALEVKGARADYRVVPVLRPGIKHTALRLWFPEEPIAVRVEEGPLGLIEAMPELLAALGVREPTDHEPLDTRAARPVAELVLRLSDPRMLAGEGTRRAAATARLVYDPADGRPGDRVGTLRVHRAAGTNRGRRPDVVSGAVLPVADRSISRTGRECGGAAAGLGPKAVHGGRRARKGTTGVRGRRGPDRSSCGPGCSCCGATRRSSIGRFLASRCAAKKGPGSRRRNPVGTGLTSDALSFPACP
jgi:hypothetical protein